MKYAVNEHIILYQVPEGPLEPFIKDFAEFIQDQGYAASTTHRHVLLAACFSLWLMHQAIKRRHISSGHTERYLEYRAQKVQPSLGDHAALKHLLDFLRSQRLIPIERVLAMRPTSIQRCINAYEKHLFEVRGLTKATVINYVPFVHCFLEDCFGTDPVKLSRLRANNVVSFVRHQAPQTGRKRAKLMTCALRSFLKYARLRGDVSLDLAAAVPIVPNWSMPSIPRAISENQVAQLLSSIDRSTATGSRDYAILLLLARLGLRSGEVALLDLDNIDWNAGTVSVCGKGGQRNLLPMPVDVSEAIAAYLCDGRPRCGERRVFLRTKAPVRGFRGASGVGSIVRHCIKRCGIKTPTLGAHQFRHGLATEMLRNGASLPEIGDVLGHHHPQTTKIYIKVDLEALRTLALPWPGGVQ